MRHIKAGLLKRIAAAEESSKPLKVKIGIMSKKKAKRYEKKGYLVIQFSVRAKNY